MTYILGAGSMGCLWAAYMSHATDVKFISTRSSHSQELSFELRKDYGPSSSQHYSFEMKALSELSSIDTLLLCTKSYDAPSALTALAHLLNEDSKIILFQNGLGAHLEILERMPQIPLFAATSTEGANRPTPTQVVHAGLGKTYIGPLNDSGFSKLNTVDAFFRGCDLDIQIEKDVWRRLWHKLAINSAINPFTAILDCQNGYIKESELFQLNWPALKSELHSLLALAGYPMNKPELESLINAVIESTKSNVSSMLQDIRAGRRTEIDDINGFVHRYLQDQNMDSSTNKMLWQSVVSLEN